MVLETTQLLNNALIAADPNYVPVYRQSHKNHPCSLWASASKQNFEWLLKLGLSLCEEYTYRYEKTHKCQAILENFAQRSLEKVPDVGLTDFCLCMPEEHKVSGDPVKSYQNYYKYDKKDICAWKKREIPEFMK